MIIGLFALLPYVLSCANKFVFNNIEFVKHVQRTLNDIIVNIWLIVSVFNSVKFNIWSNISIFREFKQKIFNRYTLASSTLFIYAT